MADGDFTRYQGRTHDGALKERAFKLPIWVVPQQFCFQSLVPFLRDKSFFIFFLASHKFKARKELITMSSKKTVPYRINLPEELIPKQWYNIRADMKELPDPMLNPGTM